MTSRQAQRCVILRVLHSGTEQLIKDAGVSHLIVPATGHFEALLDPFREGFDLSVLKSPEDSSKDIETACRKLGTRRVFLDITTANHVLLGNPAEGLENGNYELFVITTKDSYNAFYGAGLLDFKYRPVLISASSVSAKTRASEARNMGAIPMIALMSAHFKHEFENFESIVSGFSDLIVFWSPTILKGLKPGGSVTNEVKIRHVTAIHPAAIFTEPSRKSKVVGSARVDREYTLLAELPSEFGTVFGKIIFEDTERYTILKDGELVYFSEPVEARENTAASLGGGIEEIDAPTETSGIVPV